MLLVGDVGTITITALLPGSVVGGTTVLNTANVSTNTPETNFVNNQDSAVIVPVAVAALPPVIPPIPPTVELPRTGVDVGGMLRLAALLAAGGIAAIWISRRRRTLGSGA